MAADITDVSFSGDTGVAVGLGGTLVRLQRTDQTWRVSKNQVRIGSTKQFADRERREVGNGMKLE